MRLSTSAILALAAASLGWLARPAAAYLWALYVYLLLAGVLFLRLVLSLLASQVE